MDVVTVILGMAVMFITQKFINIYCNIRIMSTVHNLLFTESRSNLKRDRVLNPFPNDKF